MIYIILIEIKNFIKKNSILKKFFFIKVVFLCVVMWNGFCFKIIIGRMKIYWRFKYVIIVKNV